MVGVMVGALTNLKTAEIHAQIGMRVARRILDVQKMEGAAALKLLESASAGVGKAGDALVAKATGLGGQLDIRA